PTPEGPLPAVGAMVEAIRVSTEKRPIIVGKPYPYMFKKALEDFSQSSRIVMVGDNPYTDVLGAHQVGIPAILVSDQKTKNFHLLEIFVSRMLRYRIYRVYLIVILKLKNG